MPAAEDYARHRGEPGTGAYRAAWLQFRERIRTHEDLARWQSKVLLRRSVIRVLDAAAKNAMQIDGAPMGNAQLFEAHLPALQLAAQSGFTTEVIDFFNIVDDAASACGNALSTGRPVWVPDITPSSIFAGTRSLQIMLDAGSRAVASLPVTDRRGRLIAMISTHHVRPTRWTDQRRRELEHLSQEAGRRLHDMIGTPSQSPSHRSPNGSTLNCPTIPPDSPAASSAPPSNTTSPPATSTSRSKPSHKPAEPPPPGPHRPPPRPTLDRHHDRHARTPGRIGPRSSAPRAGIRRDPVQRSLAIREIACRTGRGRRPSRGPRAPLGDADRARPPPWAFDARGGDLSGRFVLAPVRASGRRQ